MTITVPSLSLQSGVLWACAQETFPHLIFSAAWEGMER